MTNPTLISQDSPYSGFTVATVVEALLTSRGLTNDATTGRMPASTDENAHAHRDVRRALDELDQKFPSVWAFRTVSATWVANDHSYSLPANCGQVLEVRLNGLPLRPMSRDDLAKQRRSTDEGGGILTEGGTPTQYRIMGYADASAGADLTDLRQVLRIWPTPTSALSLDVDYVSMGSDLATEAEKLPVWPTLQTWVLERAKVFWCSDVGDDAAIKSALTQMAMVESLVGSWLDGTHEAPQRVTWRFPNPGSKRRSRYRNTGSS